MGEHPADELRDEGEMWGMLNTKDWYIHPNVNTGLPVVPHRVDLEYNWKLGIYKNRRTDERVAADLEFVVVQLLVGAPQDRCVRPIV